jgi:two-component system response regulator DesR
LVEALREVAAGGLVLPPQIAAKAMRGSPASLVANIARELEAMELVHQGLRNGEISQNLSISTRTVEAHVSNIVSKMGARNRTDAVRIAQEQHLL